MECPTPSRRPILIFKNISQWREFESETDGRCDQAGQIRRTHLGSRFIVKILVLTNLFPPHHAGTYDFRCQLIVDALRLRGHETRVLTSNHGLQKEQRDAEVERRLLLNGVYGHARLNGYQELQALEIHNHRVMREAIAEFQPEVIHVWSLFGLSKSLIFTLRQSQLPVVYDIADHWLAKELLKDPWLQWWNRGQAPLASKLARLFLELTGKRESLDAMAPTRHTNEYQRLPELFDAPDSTVLLKLKGLTIFHFERIYFCSQSIKELTEQGGLQVSHGEVIYPGIPSEQYFGEVKPRALPVNKFLIATRLTKESGVLTALKAFQMARREPGFKAILNVYGRGDSDYIAQLRSFVIEHELPVEFLNVSNPVKDMPAVYRAHDAFLHTSEWDEPFAIAPLEAMACGLPVIGARSGGATELFRHGENSLTYPPGEIAELAARILELHAQSTLRQQIAGAAQTEVLSKFNESVVTDRIENYLEASRTNWRPT